MSSSCLQGLAKELDHESMQQFVGHGACRLLCQHILVAKGQLQTILFGLLAIMIGRAYADLQRTHVNIMSHVLHLDHNLLSSR